MNKPRLIDAESLKLAIEVVCGEHPNTMLIGNIIDSVPTAYDVQGVVEQLEKEKEYTKLSAIGGNELEKLIRDCYCNAYDIAIEIVRKGSAE